MNGHLDAASIAKHYGGKPTTRGFLMRCPAHDDRTPSCTIADGDNGLPIVRCWSAGCEFSQIRAALQEAGHWPGESDIQLDREEIARRRREREAREEADNLAREADALALWSDATPLQPGGIAQRYLSGRGFYAPYPPTLRQTRYTSAGGKVYPALIAAACRYPGRTVVCVQITPLKPDGTKAWNTPSRITRGRLPGAAVRVSPWVEGQRIVLTEGVEDAMAIALTCPDVAAWAVLGTANASTVQLPPRVPVTLAFDGDKAGRSATDEAAKAHRNLGHEIMVADIPDGMDPASLLLEAQS